MSRAERGFGGAVWDCSLVELEAERKDGLVVGSEFACYGDSSELWVHGARRGQFKLEVDVRIGWELEFWLDFGVPILGGIDLQFSADRFVTEIVNSEWDLNSFAGLDVVG